MLPNADSQASEPLPVAHSLTMIMAPLGSPERQKHCPNQAQDAERVRGRSVVSAVVLL